MQAILLTGHGGLEKLTIDAGYRRPEPAADQVLIEVGAAGINNTDINTRIGWYSKSVSSETGSGAAGGFDDVEAADASWSGAALEFPRIQGADVCGTIIGVGKNVSRQRIGERVIVRSMQPDEPGPQGLSCKTFGSEFDGGFAEFAVAKSDMALAIKSDMSDAELASFPCAYSTAENMLERIGLRSEDRILVTGASGGVGSAAVQLARRRGCTITAIASRSKHAFVRDLGAERVIDRNCMLLDEVDPMSIDVVVDLVAGKQWPQLLQVLKRGGRYVTAGAIAGPICEIDIRTLYLSDLTLAGSTYQPLQVFENLVRYIEDSEIQPVVSKLYPFSAIAEAQTDFIEKRYPGKLVLVPDAKFAAAAAIGETT